ncbi:aromatic-ring-hydroxylating dioxygenase subunit beta [Ramlibacter sp. AN1133]|uniref:aromatic-ring-hydroxylating dioxygenase subunit beta n=1 Tax=Ramlibacter sp. AN1133 TaxID=3133429 RepID=UPI0030C1938D
MNAVDRAQAESWLHHEAALIDDYRLTEWMALFMEDALYWLPIDENAQPGRTVALICDNSLRRRERVYRLLETRAHAQEPASRTIHLVSNVQVQQSAEEEAVVLSNQIIYEIRAGTADYRQLGLGQQRSFAARCEHRYRLQPGGDWKIALKKMVLLNRDVAIENLTFVL